MNEKYEIIIKDNGKEIKRVSTKGFLLTALYEETIYKSTMVDGISDIELAVIINANEELVDELVDELWESCGVTSREKREIICGLVRMAKMAVEEGAEE